MNEVSDAAQIARQSWSLLCPSDAVPVRVLTDGERFANHPAPDAAPISAARQSGDVLESQLPQLRAMAMLLAAQLARAGWRNAGAAGRRGGLAGGAYPAAGAQPCVGDGGGIFPAGSGEPTLSRMVGTSRTAVHAGAAHPGGGRRWRALPAGFRSRSAEVALSLAGGRARLARHCERRLQALLARVS